jgi:hypothetical protein
VWATGAENAGPHSPEDGRAMTEPRINRSWKAPEGYREQFTLAERLRGITGFAYMRGEISDQEADLIEAATDAAQELITWQWRERWVNAILAEIERPATAELAPAETEAEPGC